jgi:hypothetical protein
MTMYFKSLLVGLCAAAAVVNGHAAVGAQWFATPYWTTFAPANDVLFIISTDQMNYLTSASITVKYEIVNVYSKPLFVPQHVEMLCPPVPHVIAWLESADGHYGASSERGASCGKVQQTVTQRMTSGAILLKAGGHTNGTLTLTPRGLPLGEYRLEAVLSGWKPEDFSATEQGELAKMGAPFLRGEVPASVAIRLTPPIPRSSGGRHGKAS